MQIGLFIGENAKNYNFPELIGQLGDKVAGYNSNVPCFNFPLHIKFIPNPFELLATCDVALVFSKNKHIETIPQNALRKGKHLFLGDLPIYSLEDLAEIQSLQHEVNLGVGFGFSGVNILEGYNQSILPKDSFFIDMQRGLPFNTDFFQMKRIITYDIATLIRLPFSMLKRLRVAAFPIDTSGNNLLNIRFEISNGSVYCYTINRLSASHNFSYTLYGNQMQNPIKVNLQDMRMGVGFDFLNNEVLHFIQSIENGERPCFSTDKAIQTHNLLKEIDNKIIVYQEGS